MSSHGSSPSVVFAERELANLFLYDSEQFLDDLFNYGERFLQALWIQAHDLSGEACGPVPIRFTSHSSVRGRTVIIEPPDRGLPGEMPFLALVARNAALPRLLVLSRDRATTERGVSGTLREIGLGGEIANHGPGWVRDAGGFVEIVERFLADR
jgi:hypothetical protein